MLHQLHIQSLKTKEVETLPILHPYDMLPTLLVATSILYSGSHNSCCPSSTEAPTSYYITRYICEKVRQDGIVA